jgi:hypothetical protein
MLLDVMMSLTWERVTGKGSGFRGINGTRGKPEVMVYDYTNLGNTCKEKT